MMMRFFLSCLAIVSLLCAPAVAAPETLTARDLIGARVIAGDGVLVGRVSDLLCDTLQGRIADLVVARGGMRTAVPWTALPSPVRNATITVSAAAVTEGVSVDDALNRNPMLRRVEHGLVGRAVVSADGAPVGRVAGLTFDPQSGAVESLAIGSGGVTRAAKELPWRAIADIALTPIVVDLDAAQIVALPSAGAKLARF